MTRSIFSGGIAMAALAVAIAAQPAMAEDAPGDQPKAQGEEIVVTAEKREQRLLDVPQSISVVEGATLEQQHAETFADYTKLVPGLQLDQGREGGGQCGDWSLKQLWERALACDTAALDRECTRTQGATC